MYATFALGGVKIGTEEDGRDSEEEDGDGEEDGRGRRHLLFAASFRSLARDGFDESPQK